MTRERLEQVGQKACVCVTSWLSLQASALADAQPAGPPSSGLGLGGAYLFGLVAGLMIFGVRYAVSVRKAHLAEYGK